MQPVITKVLGQNDVYTTSYIKNTIDLVKSISLVNSKEARMYSDYLYDKYGFLEDKTDQGTWRYYLHLSGLLHQVDAQVSCKSVDNGQDIFLSIHVLKTHRKTKLELLKFGSYYDSVIAAYPEQELYVKACLTLDVALDPYSLLDLPDFKIVSYNKSLVESNELDLIHELDIRIANYKVHKLIPYYALSDSLFIASQYHILYNFLVTALLSIRLANSRSYKVHSYHLKNYLASNYNLDQQFRSLTVKQALFLHRNLKYLSNTTGIHNSFNLLIEKLFTDRNISLAGIRERQTNSLAADNSVDYRFYLELLNSKPLVYDKGEYGLDYIESKELELAKSNEKEYDLDKEAIEDGLKYGLNNDLKTKDIYSFVTDATDSVKYKLVDTLVDYWAYMLDDDRLNFVMGIQDPVTNSKLDMHVSDMFKLFIVVLHAKNGLSNIETQTFPSYTSLRTYNKNLPTKEELYSKFHDKKYSYPEAISELYDYIPPYVNCSSTYDFYSYVMSIYKYNIGSWLHVSNLHDKHEAGQMQGVLDNCSVINTYEITGETVSEFISRVSVPDIFTYQKTVLEDMAYNILDTLFDGRLSFLYSMSTIQKDLIEVFKKFNSYTVQIVEEIRNEDNLVTNLTDPRYYVSNETKHNSTVSLFNFRYDTIVSRITHDDVILPTEIDATVSRKIYVNYDTLNYQELCFPIHVNNVTKRELAIIARLPSFRIDDTKTEKHSCEVVLPVEIELSGTSNSYHYDITLPESYSHLVSSTHTNPYYNNFNLINDLDDYDWETPMPATEDNLFLVTNL